MYIYIMKKVFIPLAVILFLLAHDMAFATPVSDSSELVLLNQRIDDWVVQKNLQALDDAYASDFVFSHGSGRVEGKSGWLRTVGRANYPLRKHDSVSVELHPELAVVKGKMSIEKINKDKTDRYHLRYIRVYVLRNKKWQMVSHITTQEWHE